MTNRCHLTDLHTECCACNQHQRAEQPTVINITALEKLAGHPLPNYRVINLDSYHPHLIPDAQPLDRIDGQATSWCTSCGHYPRSRDRWLCDWCTEQWMIDLRNTPALTDDLNLAITRQTRMGAGGKTSTTPLPFNYAASHALHDLDQVLRNIATALLGAVGQNTPGMLAHQLLDNHRDISRRQDAPDLAGPLRKAVRRGTAIIDRPRPTIYLGACSTCNLALHAPDGVNTHRCACGAIYVIRVALTERRDAIADMLVTWPELVDAKPAPRSTLYWWRKTGRLRPATEWMGRPMYRYGDALDLRDTGT